MKSKCLVLLTILFAFVPNVPPQSTSDFIVVRGPSMRLSFRTPETMQELLRLLSCVIAEHGQEDMRTPAGF